MAAVTIQTCSDILLTFLLHTSLLKIDCVAQVCNFCVQFHITQLRYKPSSFQTDALWFHPCDLLMYLSLSISLQHSTMEFPNCGSPLHSTDTFKTLAVQAGHQTMMGWRNPGERLEEKRQIAIVHQLHRPSRLVCCLEAAQQMLQRMPVTLTSS